MPDTAWLAALHVRCFTLPRPWSAAEFAAMLDMGGSFLLLRDHGFLLGRAIAGEAELLTLAVAPELRRQGIAMDLLGEFTATARKGGADTAFLEVASDNLPAQALYARAGWQGCGRRKSYYAPGVDALVLRLDLPPDGAFKNG